MRHRKSIVAFDIFYFHRTMESDASDGDVRWLLTLYNRERNVWLLKYSFLLCSLISLFCIRIEDEKERERVNVRVCGA